MFYRLANRVQVVEANGKVYLVDDELQELVGCTGDGLRALRMLQSGCEQTSLDALLGPEGSRELVGAIMEAGLLRTTPLPRGVDDIFAKQLFYFDDFGHDPLVMQERLSQSTVAIVGVGGVGAVALQHLVGAGVGSLVLVEPDRVSLDNLNRQYIYHREQVGMRKAEAAAHYVRSVNPACRVSTLELFIDQADALEAITPFKPDLIVNAADQPAHVECIISDYCTRHGVAFTTCAVGRHVGTWGPLVIPGVTVCMACWLRSEELQMDCEEQGVRSRMEERIEASFGPTNSIVTSFMIKDALLYLAAGGEVANVGVRHALDFETLTIEKAFIADVGPCACWKGG